MDAQPATHHSDDYVSVTLEISSRLDDAVPDAEVQLYIAEKGAMARNTDVHRLTLAQAQDISERLAEAVQRGRRMVQAGRKAAD